MEPVPAGALLAAFLLAVWSVVLRDVRMLVVVAVVGSFCMQTHISYLGLVGGLGLVAVAAAGYHWFRADRQQRRRDSKWILVAVALGVVLWIPSIIDQLSHSPGNLVARRTTSRTRPRTRSAWPRG